MNKFFGLQGADGIRVNLDHYQALIRESLGVVGPLAGDAEIERQIDLRVLLLKEVITSSQTKALVLGISGGVDSLTAGLLCQRAVNELRQQGYEATFYAMRLPYGVQKDEADAQLALSIINPDKVLTVNIEPSVNAMMDELGNEGELYAPAAIDFTKGNVKARARMIAQYGVANLKSGLVVGTDHAAEAVMGFFTKFGDGACDVTPLSGLVKSQVRQFASYLGAPDNLVYKVPIADLEDLVPGKPDEEAYGCTYDQIDAFLLGERIDSEVAYKIISQYVKTDHKRCQPYGLAAL